MVTAPGKNHRGTALGLLAIGLAAWGAWGVAANPGLGLALFVGAGALLFLAKPAGQGWFEAGGRFYVAQPFLRWEWMGVALLALFSIAIRFYRLDLYPPGASFPEAMQANLMDPLLAGYSAFVNDFHVGWSTLTNYESYCFMKLFGWNTVSMRLPSACWGTLGTLAFYFAMRRIFHPSVALAASLMMSANNLFLVISRELYPSAIIIFSVTAGLYFLLKGIQDAKVRWFLAAGFCVGLSMHGYHSGRPLIGFFLIWLFFVYLFQPKDLPSPRRLAVFLAGFALIYSPILYWIAFQGQEGAYWGHVQQMNAYGANGLKGYLDGFLQMLPLYSKMFHVIGDGRPTIDDGLPLIPILGPDLLAKALFPMGLFFACCMFWKPLPAFMIGLLLVGALPGMLGANFPHPTTRRVIAVIPAVYFFAAFASDRLLALARERSAKLGKFVAGLLVAGAVVVAAQSTHSYFVRVMGSAEMRIQMNSACMLAGQAITSHPEAQVRLGYNYWLPECDLMRPRKRPYARITSFEDCLTLDRHKDSLLFLDPNMEPYLGALKGFFPHAETRVYPIEDVPHFDGRQDIFNPRTLLVEVRVPASDSAVLYGMLDGAGGRVDVSAADFGARNAGKNVRLTGFFSNGPLMRSLMVESPWRSLSLKVDGKPWPWGKALPFMARSALIELEGLVPANATGALPLKLVTGSAPPWAADRLLAIDRKQGFRAELRKGLYHWDGPVEARFTEYFPLLTVVETPYEPPYSARYEAWLRVDRPGAYLIRQAKADKQVQIYVDSHSVFFHVGMDKPDPKPAPVLLSADKPSRLRVDFSFEHGSHRTLYLEYRREGEDAWHALPQEWLSF